MLLPNSTIGIVGGGQLGRMSAVAAARLGFRTHILSDIMDAPAAQVASGITVGSYHDQSILKQFAEQVDVITFEFENINIEGIEYLATVRPVHPSSNVLKISQDRFLEKDFLNQHDIPTTQWISVFQLEDGINAAEKLGFPFILKTTRLGYDGKGQAVIRTNEEFKKAFKNLNPHPLIAEKKVNFYKEISVMVVQNEHDELQTFDVTENRHKNGILDLSIAPARITSALQNKAKEIAVKIAQALKLVGILGVEMFIDDQDNILVNEIAPRPHNSGHWTMNACPFDQFEMHIRAVANLPLPPIARHSDAIMKNLIGPQTLEYWPKILENDRMIGHLYGKKEAKPGRKMGHVNINFPYNGLPGEFGIKAALSFLCSGD